MSSINNTYDINENIYMPSKINMSKDVVNIKEEDRLSETYTITIIQPTNGVIEVVTFNDEDKEDEVHTSTFTTTYDTKYKTRFKDNSNPDNLYINETNNSKLSRDITIQAISPTTEDKLLSITLMQTDNQTIIAYGVKYNDNNELVYTGVSYTDSFFAEYGSLWRFTLIPNKSDGDYYINIIQSNNQVITVHALTAVHDWKAGVLVSYPDDDRLTAYPETDDNKYQYTICRQNCRIFATLPYDISEKEKDHTVTIIQSEHESITLIDEDGYLYTSRAILRDKIKYKVIIKSDTTEYQCGNVVINGTSTGVTTYSGTLTSDIVITAENTVSVSPECILHKAVFDISNTSSDNSDGKLELAIGTDEKSIPVTVYQYSNDKIFNYPKRIGLTSETIDTVSATTSKISSNLVLDTSKNYTSGKTMFIQNQITRWYNKKYLSGYFEELSGSDFYCNTKGNKMVSFINISDSVKVFVIGYTLDSDGTDETNSNITSDSQGCWVLGLSDNTKGNKNTSSTITKIKLYFYDSNNKVIATLDNFQYIDKISSFNTSNQQEVVIYEQFVDNGPVDKMYLYLLKKDDIKLRIGIYG